MDKKDLSLLDILGLIFSKLWIVVIFAIVIASAGYIYGMSKYKETYTATATFVVVIEEPLTSQQNSVLQQQQLSASLINTFPYILMSDDGVNEIIKSIDDGSKLTHAVLRSYVSITPIENTNILKMSVKTDKAAKSKLIVDKIIEYYPSVLARTMGQTASLEVLNKATLPAAPDKYNDDVRFGIVGLGAGIVLGIALIMIMELLRKTFKSTDDIQEVLDLNVISNIPAVKKEKNQKGLLITNRKIGFSFIETFKSLRTKIEHINIKKGYKSFVVSSALENEGKTTVLVNLALALSKNLKKVLIIDADMRNPAVYKILDIKNLNEEESLASLLNGVSKPEECIKYIENLNLYVLPSIRSVPNSSELLSSENMKALVEEMKKIFDIILIDSAPASIVTDSEVLTTAVDASLLVLRYDFASYKEAKESAKALSSNDAELLGVVFNASDKTKTYYRKYGNYKYGNYKQ